MMSIVPISVEIVLREIHVIMSMGFVLADVTRVIKDHSVLKVSFLFNKNMSISQDKTFFFIKTVALIPYLISKLL